mmetsp:Transcript_36253/g.41295  ORF Transcript_36253/g.41295 Transcript_36253/m.41295 type:complete len:126 (+) Transcript_36253:228-605(+)
MNSPHIHTNDISFTSDSSSSATSSPDIRMNNPISRVLFTHCNRRHSKELMADLGPLSMQERQSLDQNVLNHNYRIPGGRRSSENVERGCIKELQRRKSIIACENKLRLEHVKISHDDDDEEDSSK